VARRARRALRTWFRIPKHSALARKDEAVKASVEIGPIGQISRTVEDIAQAEAWYRDVLGLPHLYTFGTLAFFDCGGTRLFLSQRQEGGEAADSILYFRVDDIEAAHGALAARGVGFTHAPHKIHTHADGTEEWMAFFEDPEGRPLALLAQVTAR
jgi:catechol 2,3-dioxygenase-like lactoylglutathione lyase family enzyme